MSAERKRVLAPWALAVATAASPFSACAQTAPDAPADAPRDAGDGGIVLPRRALVARPLLATSTRNLLLDPFVTPDLSWGHFVGLVLPGTAGHHDILLPKRAWVSQAPAGVSAPVAAVGPVASIDRGSTGVQLVAPIPGGATGFDASVWISAFDAKGNPVDDDAASQAIAVALLPNDQPSQTYPLAPAPQAPLVLGARRWRKLALPHAVPLLEGGWFSISITSRSLQVEIQAPEVVPAPGPEPAFAAITAMRTPDDHAVLRSYVETIRRGP